jgi:hypothetical protein
VVLAAVALSVQVVMVVAELQIKVLMEVTQTLQQEVAIIMEALEVVVLQPLVLMVHFTTLVMEALV